MEYENIICQVEDGICKITLNRPKSLNAFNIALLTDLKAGIEKAASDSEVAVIVLTGAGRAFSAGVDISGPPEQVVKDKPLRLSLARGIIDDIQSASKVVIAMVNGHCLTGALEIALSCDLIVASTEAKFGDTHAHWGLTPVWGMSQRLPLAVGLLKAREMSFTCDIISGEQAHQFGLVNAVAPPDKLEETVNILAKKIKANSSHSIAAFKYLYNQGQIDTIKGGLELETKMELSAGDTSKRLDTFSHGSTPS